MCSGPSLQFVKEFLRFSISRPDGKSWEKESIHRPAPVQNFSLPEKNGGNRGKISVVDMVFLVFIGFCIRPRAGKFFFEARKVPLMIFFRWWSCTLFPSLKRTRPKITRDGPKSPQR